MKIRKLWLGVSVHKMHLYLYLCTVLALHDNFLRRKKISHLRGRRMCMNGVKIKPHVRIPVTLEQLSFEMVSVVGKQSSVTNHCCKYNVYKTSTVFCQPAMYIPNVCNNNVFTSSWNMHVSCACYHRRFTIVWMSLLTPVYVLGVFLSEEISARTWCRLCLVWDAFGITSELRWQVGRVLVKDCIKIRSNGTSQLWDCSTEVAQHRNCVSEPGTSLCMNKCASVKSPPQPVAKLLPLEWKIFNFAHGSCKEASEQIDSFKNKVNRSKNVCFIEIAGDAWRAIEEE